MLSKLTDSKKTYLIKLGTKGPNVRYKLNEVLEVREDQLPLELDMQESIIEQLQLKENHKKVLRICIGVPKTAREIMDLIGIKDKEHFRKSYLKELLEIKLLRMNYPDNPKHPFQRYFTDMNSIQNLSSRKHPGSTPDENQKEPNNP